MSDEKAGAATTPVGDSSKEQQSSGELIKIKNQRATAKRRITVTLKKLDSTIMQYGSRTIIRGYVSNVNTYLNQAEELNEQFMNLIPEKEHEIARNWYEEQFERVQDSTLQAKAHLEERQDEETSDKSTNSCSSSASKAAEIRAKAYVAEVRARQLAEEEKMRKQHAEIQLKLERQIQRAQEEAELARQEAEAEKKIRQAKDEVVRLTAEVSVLENAQNDPESLANRLHDFDDPAPEKQPFPEIQVNQTTTSEPRATTPKETSKPLCSSTPNKIHQMTVTFADTEHSPTPKVPMHGPTSWIMQLQNDTEEGSACIQPIRQSLPKLKLNQFDGDPLLWSDWSSMFKSIIHDANISLNAKMQHLQNSVTGKAKAAVEGFGYGGDSYCKALYELESRFGKPSIVVKATLDKLRKSSRLQDDKFQEVRNFSDTVSTAVWTLKRFGYTNDLAAEANLSLVLEKLSRELRIKWKEHTKQKNLDQPTLEDFSSWLKDQAEIYEECSNRSAVKAQLQRTDRRYRSSGPSVHGNVERQTTLASAVSPQARRVIPSCIMGDGNHKLHDCPKFKELSVKDRFREVRKHDLCFSCFGRRHQQNNCRLQKQCGTNGCTRLHNAMLHQCLGPTMEASGSNRPPTQQVATAENSNTSHVVCHSVLLQVVPVTLHGPKGHFNTYGMLDTGSTCSLILSDIAERLGLDGPQASITLNGIQRTSELSTKRVNVQVSPTANASVRYDVDGVLVVDHLNVPERKINLMEVKSSWPHLSDLELPEVDGSQVTVLLGSDVAEIIIPLEVRCGPKGAPVGVRTRLGWTVTGRLPGYLRESESVYKVHVSSPEEDLHEQVKSWWRTEDFGCKYDGDTQRSVEDQRVLTFLDERTDKVNGRYEVPLLWKNQNSTLPNNRILAVHRLNQLEKRLHHDPTLASSYEKTIGTDLEKGYVKKLTKDEIAAPVKQQWYLPHHPVLNPNKPGKVRRVCDAASKFQGSSLNDHLVTGPDLLNSLTGILLRFREEKVALSADIEAMFNQVLVPKDDQSVLRFLWRESPEAESETYQYLRHIFGAKCAPTCANYALVRNARDNGTDFPEAALAVERNFYMDDFFKSIESVEKALQLQQQLVRMLALGGFRLTKWISSEEDVLKHIPEPERAPSVKVVDGDIVMPTERALGVTWNTRSDCLVYHVKKRAPADTRRKILSLIATLFDPIGFLAPFLVLAKIFLQQVWQLGIGWDDRLPEEFLREWALWQDQLDGLAEFSVPRFYRHVADKPTAIQLHVFGDASERAFCSVGYFRLVYASGSTRCVFITAKTRVAPQKQLSIPRLELQAAVLSVRLSTMIVKEHDYVIEHVYFWTDSSTVLQWIQGTSKRHPSFIANRVGEILDVSEPFQWSHCPGKLNPADDGSRGLPAVAINRESRWLNGPAYLLLPDEQWPKWIPKPDSTAYPGDNASEEVTVAWINSARETTPEPLGLANYSSLTKLLRVAAYLIRFSNNCRRPKSERLNGPLLVRELEHSKKTLIKLAQGESFPDETQALQSNQQVHGKSKLVALSPFLDEDGLIRVGGRIEKADVPFSARHPIVLAPDHELSRLMIMNMHEKSWHEGVDHVRNMLRQEYWILRCRTAVRKFVHDCAYCKRRRAKPEAPKMAGLPRDRLQIAPPFSKVGVDFFGPLKVKHLRKQEKRYGCLFTCLVVRAVHLEVAFDLSTDSFIMCLRRFISRRGKPSVIHSDNGTNFVGANSELRECLQNWNQDKITTTLSQEGIQWVFNPPAAPHMGGVWERLVRSCKKALTAVLQNQVLTDEVLSTALVEVESLVNSRPLTEVSSEVDDLEALTPNHFILGRANPNLPPDIFVDKEISSRKRWRQAQVIASHIWARWLREYLPTLMARKKWCKDVTSLKVGDLVLVTDPSTPRGSWPLGRIVQVFPGDDNVVRAAEVKTKFGLTKRPAVKLALLEECSPD